MTGMAKVFLAIALAIMAVGCGGADDGGEGGAGAATTCLIGDTECLDGGDAGQAPALPDAVALGDPTDPNAPQQVPFGGFFFSDGTTSRLCGSMLESFPPQCGDTVIEIDAPLETALDAVAESFGNPEDAKINIDQGIYWTDDWVNLTGTLNANRLVLDS